MLNATIKTSQVNYETCTQSLFMHLQPKLEEKLDGSVPGRLLKKMGNSAPEVLCRLLHKIPDSGKTLILCELANQYEDKLIEGINLALAGHELARNLSISSLRFENYNEELEIQLRNVAVNYSELLRNPMLLDKLEVWVKEYAKEVPGLKGHAIRALADTAPYKAMSMITNAAPEMVESIALKILNTEENRKRFSDLLNDSLKREGFEITLGEVVIQKHTEAALTGEIEENAKIQRTGLSDEAWDLLLDALAEFLIQQ